MLIIIPKFFRVKWIKPFLKKKAGIKFQGPLPHHLFFNLPQKSEPPRHHMWRSAQPLELRHRTRAFGGTELALGLRVHRLESFRAGFVRTQEVTLAEAGCRALKLLGKTMGILVRENVGDVRMEVIDSRSLDSKFWLMKNLSIWNLYNLYTYIGVK